MLQVIYVLIYTSKQKKLVLLLLPLISSTICKKCPIEYSSISGTTSKALWISDNIENQIVLSVPPCFDGTSRLITRVCIDGFWNPLTTPHCGKISNVTTDMSVKSNPNEYETYRSYTFWPREQIDSVETGKKYGSTVSIDFSSCLFIDSKIENCTKFSLDACPPECKTLSSTSKCYCKSQNCQKIATIKNLNDKKLIQSVAAHEMCRVNEDRPNIFSLNGMHPYINASVWMYSNVSTNCTICETSINSETSRLVLSFEEKKHELYLVIYSPKGIIAYNDNFLIFCFTNAARTTLKEKSNTFLIFNHSDSDPSFPNTLLVYRIKIEKYMGEYWCEAFTSNSLLLKSDTVIAYEKKKGNEYALRLVIHSVCKFSPCDLEDFFKFITKKKLKERFKKFNTEIRVMEVFKFDIYNDIADILVHVSTGKNCDVTTEYDELLEKIERLRYDGIVAVDFRSSEFCLPERTRVNQLELDWPLARINSVVVPKQFCLESDGTPVIRQCQGNFLYGAFWSNVTGYCTDNPAISTVTTKLRNMATSLDTSVEDVWNIVKHANLMVLDIYYLDIILEQFPDNDYALDFVDKLMVTEDETVKKSQNVLNLADTTLDIIETIVANLTSYSDLVYSTRKDNLIVHVTNPFQSNISGLLVYEDHVEDFQRGDSFEDVDKENLELALFVPEIILDQILNDTNNSVSDVVIMTVVFYNDHFFVDDDYHSGSFVVSVSIPGYGTYLKSPIPILFKSKNHTHSNMCGFWDNGKKTHWKKGTWSVLGSNYVQNHTNDLHECSFIHLTHFALLVMSDKKNIPDGDDDQIQNENLEDMNEYILEVLTVIGCVLSGLGILGIFLTAFFYETWRKRIGTKILLNLSIAIFLEIICIHLSEIKFLKTSQHFCKVVGMILHYVVLSKFSWMLIYAWLQYYRFVRVIGAIPKNLILKAVIVGWGVPLAFVSGVGLINTESYASSSYELCYPRGVLLYATVLVPICLIMIANIIIFCLVMYNIAQSNKTSTCGKNNMFRLRLYLALLLFSVLGIPWAFGLLAEVLTPSSLKIVLFYTFCVTATVQGFVLFLFYVVLNRETRQFWVRYFTSKK